MIEANLNLPEIWDPNFQDKIHDELKSFVLDQSMFLTRKEQVHKIMQVTRGMLNPRFAIRAVDDVYDNLRPLIMRKQAEAVRDAANAISPIAIKVFLETLAAQYDRMDEGG